MQTKFLLTILFIVLSYVVYSQDYNPFKSIGKKGKIVTAYGNRFVEVFDYDSIQRIGSVMFNIRTKKIVKLLNADTTFKKRSDNSSVSRWYSIDRKAESFYNVSPYNFVENNPILYNDPDGDSLIVAGSNSAVSTFQSVANTGLGGVYTLGQTSTGKYILNSTGQSGTMTSEQQAMYNTLNETISNPKDVSFTAVDKNDAVSQNINFGDNGKSSQSATPGVHTIDVGDMKSLGSKGLITAQGALGHEIKEGFEIQTKNLASATDINNAHYKDAFGAENAINGTNRTATNAIDMVQGKNPNVMIGNFKVLVPDKPGSLQGHIQTVTITFKNGNIVKVSGNK